MLWIFNIFVTANERFFYLIDKICKVDYLFLFSSQLIASISNLMISLLHNIMWPIRKNVTHKAKGKNSTSNMMNETKVDKRNKSGQKNFLTLAPFTKPIWSGPNLYRTTVRTKCGYVNGTFRYQKFGPDLSPDQSGTCSCARTTVR